jgi:hypothetical protein
MSKDALLKNTCNSGEIVEEEAQDTPEDEVIYQKSILKSPLSSRFLF